MEKISLGVDLVEYRKAREFYKNHQNRLESFFNSKEIRFISRHRSPYKNLAKLLAAKEAAFKAGHEPWMGTEGFKNIQILSSSRKRNFKIRFVNSKDHVVALCAGI